MRSLMEILDSLKVLLLVHIGWRLFPSKYLEALRRFEATEEDSSWHLLRGAQSAADPRHRAELFAQTLEEIRHAEEFRAYYQRLTGRKMTRVQEEKKVLFQPGETWRLFAFCFVGENDAATRFGKIARTGFEPGLTRLLKRILADEEGHTEKAESLLGDSGESRDRLRREIRAIRLRRFKEAWLRSGRNIANGACSMILAAAYFLGAGPFTLSARNRFRAPKRLSREERKELVYESARSVV